MWYSKLRFFFMRNRFGAFFWTGVALLILGVGIFSYADSVVEAHRLMMQQDLPISERNRLAGSLTWWIMAQVTLYNPISLVFLVTGSFCIAYACVWAIMQPSQV